MILIAILLKVFLLFCFIIFNLKDFLVSFGAYEPLLLQTIIQRGHSLRLAGARVSLSLTVTSKPVLAVVRDRILAVYLFAISLSAIVLKHLNILRKFRYLTVTSFTDN